MTTRHFCLLLLSLLVSYSTVRAQAGFGRSQKWNSDWLFHLGEESQAAQPTFNDHQWRRLNVPHDWSVEQPLSPDGASCTGYLPGGIGWYRKHFDGRGLPAGQKVYILFEGVYNRSTVYFNGKEVGTRPNGFSSFCYDLTPYINRDSDNVLAVRVDHSRSADSRWYTGSGIYRDVWLVTAPETHFTLWGNRWSVLKAQGHEARVRFQMEVEHPVEGLRTRVSVSDHQGNRLSEGSSEVAADGRATVELRLRGIQLWTLEHPQLYRVDYELLGPDGVVDHDQCTLGLRTFRWDADKGFALNGQWMKVKGVCLHDDAGVLGTAVPKAVWARRLKELKSIGVNAIRMSHNPHAPMLYDICDSLGLLVMDEASDEWEFPKRKWLKGWNKGEPGYQGSYDFFNEWIDRDERDMVRRDRRHASVFMWSIGNEVDYPNDPYSHPVLNGSSISQPMYGGYKPDAPRAERIGVIAQRLAKIVRAEDPTRAVTGALAGVVMSNETAYPQAVDVVGYNYTEDRYDKDHRKYPKRIIYGSENRHDLDAWKAVTDHPFIFGQFLWTGVDYLGEGGPWPSRGSSPGLLDLAGFRKPLGWWRASLWSEKPSTYIGAYALRGNGRRGARRGDNERPSMYAEDVWNFEEGQKVRVVCYTSQPQARLLLNGKAVGDVQKKNPDTGMMVWDVDYQPGTLRAEGLDSKGKVTSSYELRTSGRPASLTARVLDQTGDLTQVEVDVVDDNGWSVRLADNDVTCRVAPGVRLLGMENGDLSDITDKRDAHERVHHGRLLIYLQGHGRVKFTSPLLKSTELEL